MSSVHRILHGILTKPVRPKTKPTVIANTTAKTGMSQETGPTEETDQLQKLVNDFKSSCDHRRFRQSQSIYRRHVIELAAAKHHSMIEDILEHQKKYDDIRHEGFAIRLIELYGLSGMFDHARKLFDEMPQLNCRRTVKSFNALLKASAAAKKPEKAVEIFDEIPRTASIEPDLVSHNTLIHALCEMGSIDEALSRLQALESSGKAPNVVTFNTILNALHSRGKFLEGERIWTMMKSDKNIELDIWSYNSRLRGLFSDHRASEAVELFSEIERKGLEIDSFTYNAMITGFCEEGNIEEAKKWYDELKKSECKPILSRTYVKIISTCEKIGDLDKAFEVSFDAVSQGLALESSLVQRVVDGLVEKGRTEEALKLQKLV